MKILQINASYKPAFIYGGPTMSVSKLSEQLTKAGCSVSVFTTTANGQTELAATGDTGTSIDGVQVHYYKRITKDHSHFSPKLLLAVWKNARQFDIVHVHAWWNTVSVLSCLLAKLRGAKVIVSPRGTLSSYSFGNKNSLIKKTIHTLLGKPLLKRAVIHVTSDHEKERLGGLISPGVMYNIPNFIELPAAVPQRTQPYTTSLKLLFLSRIEEKKGLDILLDALKDVQVTFHLTIAGNGSEEYISRLKTMAVNYGLSDHISWIGFQSSEKFSLMANHDLLVLPSHDENFGNVVIESLATGTAVLISDKVGLAAYVDAAQLGWVCHNTAAAFTSCINNIPASRLKTIRAAAPALINKDFNETNLLKKYLQMYCDTVTLPADNTDKASV